MATFSIYCFLMTTFIRCLTSDWPKIMIIAFYRKLDTKKVFCKYVGFTEMETNNICKSYKTKLTKPNLSEIMGSWCCCRRKWTLLAYVSCGSVLDSPCWRKNTLKNFDSASETLSLKVGLFLCLSIFPGQRAKSTERLLSFVFSLPLWVICTKLTIHLCWKQTTIDVSG